MIQCFSSKYTHKKLLMDVITHSVESADATSIFYTAGAGMHRCQQVHCTFVWTCWRTADSWSSQKDQVIFFPHWAQAASVSNFEQLWSCFFLARGWQLCCWISVPVRHVVLCGVLARLVGLWTGMPLRRVWFPIAARDFSPGVHFQCRLSHGVCTPPVCNPMH